MNRDPDVDEDTLLSAFDLVSFLGPVLEQLDVDGHHQAAADLREECDRFVRDILQGAAE